MRFYSRFGDDAFRTGLHREGASRLREELARERANILVALRRAVMQAPPSLAYKLLVAACLDRGVDRRICVERALALVRRADLDSTLRLRVLGLLGRAYRLLGDVKRCSHTVEQAILLARELQDSGAEATALETRGVLHIDQGDASRGLVFLERSRELAAGVERDQMGSLLFAIGQGHLMNGDRHAATRAFRHSLRVSRRAGDKEREGLVRAQLGRMEELDRMRGAEDAPMLRRAVELQGDTGSPGSLATIQADLAQVLLRVGAADEAARVIGHAVELMVRLGDKRIEAEVRRAWSQVLAAQDHAADSTRQAALALSVAIDSGDRRLVSECQCEVGMLHLRLERLADARTALSASIKSAQRGSVLWARCVGALALVDALQGSPERGLRRLAGIEPEVFVGHTAEQVQFLARRGTVWALLGNLDAARVASGRCEVLLDGVVFSGDSAVGLSRTRLHQAIRRVEQR